VRGANSDHVLVLINGVRVGDATFSTKDVSSIPVQQIERVEVVRGPRAALWGSDAIGGVIQIFTRKLSNGEGQVGAKL
jgi:vitamin B12 transporter